jgi:hypothetical protein
MIELHPDEKIVMERRRFWLPIVSQAVLMAFVAIIPIILITVLSNLLPENVGLIAARYQPELLFLSAVWILCSWIIFAVNWTNYYLNVLLVTNKRILDIDQLGLFSRHISEARIENVQDMRVEVVGLLASVFDFGNLQIQTAAATEEFIIQNIRHPNEVKDLISSQHEALAKEIGKGL